MIYQVLTKLIHYLLEKDIVRINHYPSSYGPKTINCRIDIGPKKQSIYYIMVDLINLDKGEITTNSLKLPLK